MNEESDFADDQQLFQQMMQGVKRLQDDRADVRQPPALTALNARLRQQAAQAEAVNLAQIGLSDGLVRPVNPGDELNFHVPDLPLRSWKALVRGEVPWQEGLDLHGMTIEAARAALVDFIREGRQRGFKCLLLVHGKAYNREGELPSIKSHVAVWLKQMTEVLAYTSARPADGGTGAVYILLRTKK